MLAQPIRSMPPTAHINVNTDVFRSSLIKMFEY
jgi:hypothetical protein